MGDYMSLYTIKIFYIHVFIFTMGDYKLNLIDGYLYTLVKFQYIELRRIGDYKLINGYLNTRVRCPVIYF
jgi:hypothetical protein